MFEKGIRPIPIFYRQTEVSAHNHASINTTWAYKSASKPPCAPTSNPSVATTPPFITTLSNRLSKPRKEGAKYGGKTRGSNAPSPMTMRRSQTCAKTARKWGFKKPKSMLLRSFFNATHLTNIRKFLGNSSPEEKRRMFKMEVFLSNFTDFTSELQNQLKHAPNRPKNSQHRTL